MTLLRFFFGHGWWVLYHVFFYLTLLVCVALTLAIFAQDLKAPGEQPDTPSPGSILVFMIGLGLAFLTLVDAAIFIRHLRWPWYARLALVVALPAAVCVIMFPLNNLLATRQSRPVFYANLAASCAIALGNLALLYQANSPREA
jgi:hypothetical protein